MHAVVLQQELEGISEELRIPGQKALGPIQGVRTLPSSLPELAEAHFAKPQHAWMGGHGYL